MSQKPAAGTVVAGRYELVAEAGAGGFARAYEAIDRETGTTVAVKLPNYDGSSNARDVIDRYFQKEAESLEAIAEAGGHPNVMTLHERGTDDGVDYLVVEFVDGYELDEAIDERGTIQSSENVRKTGIDLCDAMSFLHENEIVYRDLKPDNVMASKRNGEWVPVLIDFNTATGFRAGSTADDSGTTILGPYKPREVADAGRTDSRQGPWSDVYSIGKILMFLLRGTVPEKDGVDPRDFGVDCDPYLAAIIEKATRPDYEDRYANATAMKYALENRDPTPPPRAAITNRDEGRQHVIYPGDTIGRAEATGTNASIPVTDEEGYISAIQTQFDMEATDWVLRDRSVNGTYVQSGDGWQWVLSESGREHLRDQGQDPTDRHGDVPPTSVRLADGDLIALVHPSYGITFQFTSL
jgi:serine/threonine protein kinase